MIKHFWPVIQSDIIPEKYSNKCIYCDAELGNDHFPGCVIRKRTWVLTLSDETEVVFALPERASEDEANKHFKSSGFRYLLWTSLENQRGDTAWGLISVVAVRDAKYDDEDKLLELVSEL